MLSTILYHDFEKLYILFFPHFPGTNKLMQQNPNKAKQTRVNISWDALYSTLHHPFLLIYVTTTQLNIMLRCCVVIHDSVITYFLK